MSVKQHLTENNIAVRAADWAALCILKLGGRPQDVIREWHRVYHEVLRIAQAGS